ncbi:MAG: hypothetical protein GTN40_02590 [Candidatus Aenigmarchaeota archaeon]|nr:hypothetical protein [Candidatus Aenigmarchaeota archaeon]
MKQCWHEREAKKLRYLQKRENNRTAKSALSMRIGNLIEQCAVECMGIKLKDLDTKRPSWAYNYFHYPKKRGGGER